MRQLLVAAVLLAVLLPAPSAAAASPMFTGAGFAKARSHPRQSILIEPSTDNDITAGIGYWNAAAGWALLRFGTPPDIHIERVTNGGGWSQWSSEAPYDSCTIGIPTSDARGNHQVVAHEIGHCLGFKHLDRGVMGSRFAFGFDSDLLARTDYRASDARVCDPGCHYTDPWP